MGYSGALRIYASDTFVLPLPERHRFPMAKYARLRERIVAAGIVDEGDVAIPPAATREQLARAHDLDYVDRVCSGAMDARELRELGFPWSPGLVERSLRSCGATIAAVRAAVDDGVAINLAGGTHHAFRDRAEGYCVFNDAAVAARDAQAEGLAARIVIVDLDVHQGNGTAKILAGDPTIFTLSLHGARNFPFRKEASDLDVALDDDTGDDAYLAALDDALERAFTASAPDLAIYLAGADPFAGDALGRLALTKGGLAARDRRVLDACADARVPVAIAMAGGYARDIDDIVDIHAATVRIAVESQPRLRDRLRAGARRGPG
ncbi:MAG: histone deacetylase [Nannocystaceae bacterium]